MSGARGVRMGLSGPFPLRGEGLFCASSGLGANVPWDQVRGVAVGSCWREGSIGGRCASSLS